MNWRLSRLRRRGATLPLVAGGIVVILGLASLTVDVGLMYVRHQANVNGVDAAALAGAMKLTESNGEAELWAMQTAAANGLESPRAVVDVNFPAEWTIRVDSEANVPTIFGRLLGRDHATVRASATARIGAVLGVGGDEGVGTGGSDGESNGLDGNPPEGVPNGNFLRPWGIDGRALEGVDFGDEITLKLGSVGNKKDDGTYDISSGNFLPLALDAPGASSYRESIKYGCTAEYEAPANGEIEAYEAGTNKWVETQTGNLVGPTKQGVDFLTSYPGPILVLVVDWTVVEKGGKSMVPIVGFASIKLISMQGQTATAILVPWVYSGAKIGFDVSQYGANGVQLM
jgi:hypothetical protein